MPTLALENLYTLVSTSMLIELPTILHYFGWEEPPRQLRSRSRVIWVPGDPAGALGDIKAPRKTAQTSEVASELAARPLVNLDELFTVYIAGNDATDPKNELKQYKATRLLLDVWLRHVYLAAHGTFQLSRPSWVPDGAAHELRHGATIRLVGAIQSVVPDSEVNAISPLDALMDLEFLSETEQVSIDNGAAP